LTPLDWIIVAFTALMAVWGYARGLVVGALTLAGFALGALAGARLGPLLLDQGSESPYAPLMALFVALVAGGVAASLLEMLGFKLRGRFGESLGTLDGFGGALLAGALGLGIAWTLGAVALQTPTLDLRGPIQRSAILRDLNAVLPPSGPILRALARFDPFPRIQGPDPDVRPPNAAVARDPEVAAAASSVVRVLGTACGLGVQGSGWIARDGLVVTNAHVVAGQEDTVVQLEGSGDELDAEAVWFDAGNDLALLRVPSLSGAPSLPLASAAAPGASAAVLGFPENGPYDVRPARVGQTRTVISQDAYGRGPVQRSITSIRAQIRSGNSGGPVVDAAGRALATVFAGSVSSDPPAGYAVPGSIVGDALRRAGGPVDTGPCAR
jgi:S1-C subfamily serine protease